MKKYIGIDLGGTSIKGGRIGPLGMEETITILVPKLADKDTVFEEICNVIERLWTGNVAGIGFAVPALFDFEKGVIHGLSNLKQLDGYPLKKNLQDRFHTSVLIQNDANCFVLGEKYFGKAQDHQNVVGLITGTGVGAGMLIDGKLYNGTNLGAGEVGMIPYKKKRFEDFCSGNFFCEHYKTSGEVLSSLACKGNKAAVNAFNEYGGHLGELIKLIAYVLDPEIIVLGGSVSLSFQHFQNALQKSLESFAFQSAKNLQVLPSSLPYIAIHGAVSLFLNREKATNIKSSLL